MTNSTDSGRPNLQAALSRRFRHLAKACSNIHRQGTLPDIFLFATPRSGSTWLMEVIASQPGFKYYDEPLSPRRENVRYGGIISDYSCLMPESGNSDRIIEFLKGLQSGRHGYMNPPPFRRNHRFLTNRIVFKIHEIEHLMRRVATECNSQLIYLLRHPIATSLSRTVQPRLELFLRSEHYANLLGTSKLRREIHEVATKGSPLQRAIVSWCFENLDVLRRADDDCLIVTYEELVLNPAKSCDLLATHFDLPDLGALQSAYERPAVNIQMSRADTIAAMNRQDPGVRRNELVSKWHARVSPAQYEQAGQVTAMFGIDAYDVRKSLASPRYLHFQDTPSLLSGPA